MDVTGTVNCQCSHVFIQSVMDLYYGERYVLPLPTYGLPRVIHAIFRYASVDFALARALRQRSSGGSASLLRAQEDDVDKVTSYDSACQFEVNAADRFDEFFPELVSLVRRTRWAIPALHIQGHKDMCMYLYSSAYMDCMCHFHGETAEQLWPEANQVGAHVKQMNNGHRQDTLNDHYGDWNWKKTMNQCGWPIVCMSTWLMNEYSGYFGQ
jgi:Kyakuja-Dileera-Zisupton transposase